MYIIHMFKIFNLCLILFSSQPGNNKKNCRKRKTESASNSATDA